MNILSKVLSRGEASSRWRFPPAAAQLDYYRRTASTYDETQVHDGDEHYESLGLFLNLIRQNELKSVLDVGCGTGRGIRYLRQHMPTLDVQGNDPSPDLLRIACEKHRVPADVLHCADVLTLPFAPGSFDAVMSLGVLHHVPEPSQVVRRMIQLARRAVFISDANYIGQGSLPVSLVKLAATKAGLWPALKYVQQGFKGWGHSEGDGIFYSYSVFNDLPLLQEAFDKVFVIPIGRDAARGHSLPMLRAPLVAAVGLR
jgi:SAM-dependent methyltransferase